jgi:hypothetical protein
MQWYLINAAQCVNRRSGVEVPLSEFAHPPINIDAMQGSDSASALLRQLRVQLVLRSRSNARTGGDNGCRGSRETEISLHPLSNHTQADLRVKSRASKSQPIGQ